MGGGGHQAAGVEVPLDTTMGKLLLADASRDCVSCAWQPFPANIMAGFYAVADSSEPVRTDLDNELEGACVAYFT